MIIPIRCFTCNNLIAHKYTYFLEKKKEYNINKEILIDENNINNGSVKKTPYGEILDEIGLDRYCCRRMFLGQVDLIELT